jgi:hypothetical protein
MPVLQNPEWGYVPTVPQTGLVMTLQPGAAACAQTIVTPVGVCPADYAWRIFEGYTAETAETSEQARALYLPRIGKAFDTATIAIRVVTKAVNLDHAEVAICKAVPGVGAAVKLTRLGWFNAKSAFEAGGAQVLSVSFTGAVAGDHLWIAWVQKAGQGTLATFEPAVADGIVSGMAQFRAATQLSTMTADTQFGILGYTVEPLWCVVGWGNA